MEHERAKNRDSSIELFRIIVMLFIIAHHYVVNSNLMQFKIGIKFLLEIAFEVFTRFSNNIVFLIINFIFVLLSFNNIITISINRNIMLLFNESF